MLDTGDRLPDGWQHERAEVLRELALVVQAIQGLREDWREWKAELTDTLREQREQDRARQEALSQLLQTCSERGVELKSTRLKVDDLQGRVKVVEGGLPVVKVLMWVGAALGLALIGLVVSLITGQAQVVFR